MDRLNDTPPREIEELCQEVDILRQMILLSRGPADPIYMQMEFSLQARDADRLRDAIKAFDALPQEDRNYTLGMDHTFEVA